MLNTDFKTPSAGLSKRANRSKFKIHVVNAAAKVLGIIIIIDYNINPSSEKQETISASFEKLTNMKTKGKDAILDFATSMVSGVIDLTLKRASTVTGIASSADVHLSGAVVAKKLLIFNEKNVKIGTTFYHRRWIGRFDRRGWGRGWTDKCDGYIQIQQQLRDLEHLVARIDGGSCHPAVTQGKVLGGACID
ncbi:hypothetical protein CGGC5_v013043 [Colletotrichum fructicola Nara gc5]|uniref:Uncharacterized protein n=1 Tax=Colletotrichum fructicola (strain Nara gc5) TaxID=1213859 RepID=A0A7J6IM75_COLFN|nr:hypothetical protein CGGC5_v013043 [Colletotrichum fructicola Nara gc5]